MRKLAAAIAVALSLVVLPAFAETVVHHVAKVTIEVPKGWKVKKDKDVVTVMDHDEDLAVSLIAVDAGEMKEAATRLEKHLEKKVHHLKWADKGKEGTLNGMKSFEIDGHGKLDGKAVDIVVVLIKTPSKAHDLIVLGIAEKVGMSKHKEKAREMIRSITPYK